MTIPRIISGLVVLILGTKTYAQTLERTVFASTGRAMTNNGLSLNFTIGEPAVGSASSGLDQGFWAGYLSIEPANENPVEEVQVFPVPVKDVLTIITNGNELIGLRLFSINGQLVVNKTNTSLAFQVELSMEHLSKGVYILHAFINGAQRKEYKLIKE